MNKFLFLLILLWQSVTLSIHDTILIIDYGSPITHHIGICLQQIHVHSYTCWYTQAEEILQKIQPKGIILAGGPNSVIDPDSPRAPHKVFSGQVPVLGICYGQQLMCVQLGGTVKKSQNPEFGRTELFITGTCALTERLWPPSLEPITIWMGHEDIIATLPEGFISLAHTQNSPHAIIADDSRNFYGVQFHPEALYVKESHALIHTFALDIVQAHPDLNLLPPKIDQFIDQNELLNRCCGRNYVSEK